MTDRAEGTTGPAENVPGSRTRMTGDRRFGQGCEHSIPRTAVVRLLVMADASAKNPLLEFDSAPQAFIEPSDQVAARDVPEACVITFFGDAVHRLRESGRAQEAYSQWVR